MRVKEVVDISYTMAQHEAKLLKLADKEVEDLSISEMAFIKMVSSGSITTMKKNGATNSRILSTEKKVTVSKKDKVKLYLKSLSPTELDTILDDFR